VQLRELRAFRVVAEEGSCVRGRASAAIEPRSRLSADHPSPGLQLGVSCCFGAALGSDHGGPGAILLPVRALIASTPDASPLYPPGQSVPGLLKVASPTLPPICSRRAHRAEHRFFSLTAWRAHASSAAHWPSGGGTADSALVVRAPAAPRFDAYSPCEESAGRFVLRPSSRQARRPSLDPPAPACRAAGLAVPGPCRRICTPGRRQPFWRAHASRWITACAREGSLIPRSIRLGRHRTRVRPGSAGT